MAIIIPHQLPLAPHPLSPLPFSADRFPIHSGPLFCFQQSAFLFPAIFSPVPFGLLSCFLCSAILFPLVRLPVPFVSLACSFWSVSLFPLFRFFVSFGPLLRFLWPAPLFPSFRLLVPFGLLLCSLCSVSCFLWSGSTRHYLVFSSFPSSFSLPLCQVFSSLSNPTHALQCWRPCPSTFETTPFLPQEHALQRSRRRLSPLVSVCV